MEIFMSNIMFFCIPAYGHTNPTIPVVRGLVAGGHKVRYYSFPEFADKIREAGACYVSCEEFPPPAPKDLDRRVGRDFASLVEMVADTTLRLEELVENDIKAFRPDCIVSDSVCFWGKLFAKRYRIPLVCSTTTMAFNRHTARLMKRGPGEMFRMLLGIPRINGKMQLLKQHGYDSASLLSILENDNETDTIVYTSRQFQPMAETFSDRYVFVGPACLNEPAFSGASASRPSAPKRPLVYVALGTVLNNNVRFYRQCIRGLWELECDVLLSAGRNTDLSLLGELPSNVSVFPFVDQPKVLSQADVFVTHCGMNSVNESLFYGVPMLLFPQHSEESAVALRVRQLGAGIRTKHASAKRIRQAVMTLLSDPSYAGCARRAGQDLKACKGAAQACAFIEEVIKRHT